MDERKACFKGISGLYSDHDKKSDSLNPKDANLKTNEGVPLNAAISGVKYKRRTPKSPCVIEQELGKAASETQMIGRNQVCNHCGYYVSTMRFTSKDKNKS